MSWVPSLASDIVGPLDTTHGAHENPCPHGCVAMDAQGECICDCERCMFRHRAAGHAGTFNRALRQAFGNGNIPELQGPRRRIFIRRPPQGPLPPPIQTYPSMGMQGRFSILPNELVDQVANDTGGFDPDSDSTSPLFPRRPSAHNALTLAIGQRPCSEWTPWDVDIRHWCEPCPNDRRGQTTYQNGGGMYMRRILPCEDAYCQQSYRDLRTQNRLLPRRRPHTPSNRRYVCEDHFEDTKRFFKLQIPLDIANFHASHLVRFCRDHERALQVRFRGGLNSCTCRNVDFTKWQCRTCFQTKVQKLQRNFWARVLPDWRGKAKQSVCGTRRPRYYRDWKKVRRELARSHPCGMSCGKKRMGGVSVTRALDCRCCGGWIIEPSVEPRRSRRLAGRGTEEEEEDEEEGEGDEGESEV